MFASGSGFGNARASAQHECVAKVDGPKAQGAVDDRPGTTDRAASLPINARTAHDRAAKRLVSVPPHPASSKKDAIIAAPRLTAYLSSGVGDSDQGLERVELRE